MVGERWEQARGGPGSGADAAFQLRFRRVGDRIEVQHPWFDRVYALVLVAAGLLWMAIAVHGRSLAVVLTVLAVIGGGLLLHRALRPSTVVDAAGWHGGKRVVPWSDVEEIVLFRGTDRRRDFLRIAGGDLLLVDALPQPWTRGASAAPPASVDALCLLVHEHAHDHGRPPVSVRVDLGRGVPSVPFVHRCARCAAGGDVGASAPPGWS